jgi:hypothetical protein
MKTLAWLGESIRLLFKTYGWIAALTVIVVLSALTLFSLWFLGVDVDKLLTTLLEDTTYPRLKRRGRMER